MNAAHAFFILFLIGFVASCSTIYNVNYDYNKQVDFINYMTYDWMPIPDKQADFKNMKPCDWLPIPNKQDIWGLNVELFKREVNNRLKAKGLMMTSKNPDFLIVQHLKIKKNIDQYIIQYDNSPIFRERKNTHSKVFYYELDLGSIFLEFVDANSKKMIWRAVAKAEVDTILAANTLEKKEKLIKKAVNEILENFPPNHYEQ